MKKRPANFLEQQSIKRKVQWFSIKNIIIHDEKICTFAVIMYSTKKNNANKVSFYGAFYLADDTVDPFGIGYFLERETAIYDLTSRSNG